MKEFIYQSNHDIDDNLCNEIISLFEKHPERLHEGVTGKSDNINGHYSGINKKIKNTTDLNILSVIDIDEDWKKISNILINKLENNMNKYYEFIQNNYGINLSRVYSTKSFHSLLIHKYKKNEGIFTYHNDFFYDKEKHKYRIFNYLWYLNDVEEGGETEFLDISK